MSDLIVNLDGIQAPPQACSEKPPVPNKTSKNSEDPCQILLPLVDDEHPLDASRAIRFDRQGDTFILSPKNSVENISWVRRHPNVGSLIDILRMTEVMSRTAQTVALASHRIRIMMAQYILTGAVRFPGEGIAKFASEKGDSQMKLANWLLGSFTVSDPEAVASALGGISVFRGDKTMNRDARERMEWVLAIMDYVPYYRAFTSHFVSAVQLTNAEWLPIEEQAAIRSLLSLGRQFVINHWQGGAISWGPMFWEAYQGYRTLNPSSPQQAAAGFCRNLEGAIKELKAVTESERQLMAQCKEGLQLYSLPQKEAIPQSLKGYYHSKEGRAALQESVAEASQETAMTIDWLAKRGRLDEMLPSLIRKFRVVTPSDGGKSEPKVNLDVTGLSLEWDFLTDAHKANQREYLLTALAFCRNLLGKGDRGPKLTVFYDGAYRDLSWQWSPEEAAELRHRISMLEKRLQVSERRTDVWLPAVEGVTCGLGIIGLGIAEGFDGARKNRDLRLGLGTSSAALTGAGCTSLIGHYLWPKLGKVRNRYAWDGVTALVGAALGTGIYLLSASLTGAFSTNNSQKFPTDEYGP